MSKVSNAILMLKILESGKVYKISELAQKLDCSPRAIRTYKEDLEKAGIYIDTILGKYGGYVYKQRERLDYYSFNKYELRALENLYMQANNLPKLASEDIKYLGNIIDKIRYFAVLSNIDNKSTLDAKIIEDYYKKISYAIHNNKKIRFYYSKRKNDKTYRTLEPQNIYLFEGKYFVTGRALEINEIRTFGFEAIKGLEIF